MKNDVLDVEKPMLMLADWIEEDVALTRHIQDAPIPRPEGWFAELQKRETSHYAVQEALTDLDPARIRQLGRLLAQLHPLAVTASSSTGTANEVRAARDELVRVCLELGGEA